MAARAETSKRDPEGNRSTLINATLESIFEDGIAETTVSKIIQRAGGLSRGMIHLHFGGKSQLLTAAAEAYSAEYYAEVDRHLAVAGDNPPEAIVMAIVSADLSDTLLNERSTRIMHASGGGRRHRSRNCPVQQYAGRKVAHPRARRFRTDRRGL